MGDYPDYTDVMQIIGSDIMVPIDLQAAYIMMPVDVQAQYVTLDIDIVAQTVGNIAVNIAAASVGNINVDINAQTVGDITIAINAQSIGLWATPDWNTKEGNGIAWTLTGANLAVGGSANTTYDVPATKTLYITQISFACWANAAADRNNQTLGEVEVTANYLGGNGGQQFILPSPIKFAAEATMTITFYNRANHTADFHVTVKGYLI